MLGRLYWLTPLLGTPLAALRLVLQIRSNPSGPHLVLHGGHKIQFRSIDETVLKEVLVDREYAFVSELLVSSPSPLVLDVGAHIGTFALWCLAQTSAARILSVEANPDTYEVLRANVRRWSAEGAALRIEHAAATAMDGEILKIRNAGPSMGHRVDSFGTLSAPSMSLPTLIDLCSPDGEDIDLAKIDIEGSEEDLICSHPEALQRIRAMAIELHPNLCNTERVASILHSIYPSIVDIGGRGSTKPLLYCRRDGGTSA